MEELLIAPRRVLTTLLVFGEVLDTLLLSLVVFDEVVEVDDTHAGREGLFGLGVFEGLGEGVDETLHVVEAFLDVVDFVLPLQQVGWVYLSLADQTHFIPHV